MIDATTKVRALAVVRDFPMISVSTVAPGSKPAEILADFPEITGVFKPVAHENSSVFHHIVTTGPPVAERPRRLAPHKLKAAKAEFNAWLEAGICHPSSSPWASPLHMEQKKDNSWRPSGDYRRLNSVTVADKYPTAHIYDCNSNLHGKKIFSKLDLHHAFNQIPVAPEDIPKTAIIIPFGLFEFMHMTFGLRNASQTFQRYINSALGDLDFVYIYIDDILIASASLEEHYAHLRIVFERLKKFHLRLNVDKCSFAVEEVEFLGYLVNGEGIRPIPSRVESILNFPKPRTIAELRRFVGAVNFYRRNMPHASTAQAPLNEFFTDSRKNDKRPVPWIAEAEEAFARVKQELANAALLVHPRIDAKIRIVSDASDSGMGAVLEQLSPTKGWEPLAFFSKKFSPSQRKYSAYDRELTAIYEAVKYFSFLVEGRDFKILTDHKPLIYAFMQKSDKASPRQTRQLSLIAQYTTCIEFIKGTDNAVADSLSRIESIRMPLEIDLNDLAAKLEADEQLKAIRDSPDFPLSLKRIQWGPEHTTIYCEITGEAIRP